MLKNGINLKENRQSDEQILKQFYQNKDFPPRPLGEKAWASHQSLLNQWLKSILELKQGKQSIHISFQKKLCEMIIYGGYFIYGEKLSVYSSPANFKLKRKIIFWIKHLFLCYHLADKNPESYWIGLNLKKKSVLKRKFKICTSS